MRGSASSAPDPRLDPDGFAAWRHEYQPPLMASMFPVAAALLSDCPVCGEPPLAH